MRSLRSKYDCTAGGITVLVVILGTSLSCRYLPVALASRRRKSSSLRSHTSWLESGRLPAGRPPAPPNTRLAALRDAPVIERTTSRAPAWRAPRAVGVGVKGVSH